jgi:hypothetical protein
MEFQILLCGAGSIFVVALVLCRRAMSGTLRADALAPVSAQWLMEQRRAHDESPLA